jgi:COP9 signalosome complex subunit 4
MLGKAVDTCILSDAGSRKDFLCSQLVKDERAKDIQNYGILEKIYNDQFVKKEEVDDFRKTLKRHQKILLENNLDNVQTAILEHNIIVTSKYFRDIKISSLSRRLKLSDSET